MSDTARKTAYDEWIRGLDFGNDGFPEPSTSWDEGYTAGYAAALHDALAAVEDSYRIVSPADAIRALEEDS